MKIFAHKNSFILFHEYNSTTQQLIFCLKDGKTYAVNNFSPAAYKLMTKHPNHGSYIMNYILNNRLYSITEGEIITEAEMTELVRQNDRKAALYYHQKRNWNQHLAR